MRSRRFSYSYGFELFEYARDLIRFPKLWGLSSANTCYTFPAHRPLLCGYHAPFSLHLPHAAPPTDGSKGYLIIIALGQLQIPVCRLSKPNNRHQRKLAKIVRYCRVECKSLKFSLCARNPFLFCFAFSA